MKTASGNERGVALIIVLGLVALISGWAATAAYEDMLSLRRAENFQQLVRASMASQSALELAIETLQRDAKDSKRDDLQEDWAQTMPPFPIDDGMVEIHIADGNRFVNINQLINAKGKPRPRLVQQLKYYFSALGIDTQKVDALIDWMDPDQVPFGPGGAEDPAYYDKPYHVRNAPLHRWQELQLVRGFDDVKLLDRLSQALTVIPLPQNGVVKLNINTASAEALQLLFPTMTRADAEQLIAARPYDDVQSALANKAWAKQGDAGRLSTSSDIFIVSTRVTFGRVLFRERFIVRRGKAGLQLLLRERIV